MDVPRRVARLERILALLIKENPEPAAGPRFLSEWEQEELEQFRRDILGWSD